MCSMAKYRPQQGLIVPHPVHPRNIRHHGLFGMPYINQHWIIDDRWTLNSLNDQFQGMNDLLDRRIIFKRLEALADNNVKKRHYRALRRQCRDGRTKLWMVLQGEHQKVLHNTLINHKDLQRLYQRMPLHMAVDNINQRTFVMRKERDRLRFRLNKLEKDYYEKLLLKAELENRIKYENEFVLEEEVKARGFRKEMENSRTRLKAIKTVNATYKKIIQKLRHDQIFYEPILSSLSADIEDQATFIKYILYLGTPAIKRFKTLSKEFLVMEDVSRKTMANSTVGSLNMRDSQDSVQEDKPASVEAVLQRYVRETDSMMFMKTELEAIENTIKKVKAATLCSRARETFPRMRSLVENNIRLRKKIENDNLGQEALVKKEKHAILMEGVLINNLTDEELSRRERIRELKEVLALEDKFEAKIIQYIKDRGDVYVMFRISLWNMFDMLRNVGQKHRILHPTYPNSYLKLPLLRFEMLSMHSCPPDSFEEDLPVIMHQMRVKVHRLMKVFNADLTTEQVREHRDEYHNAFLEIMEGEEEDEEAKEQEKAEAEKPKEPEQDLLQETKINQNVPNRKQIKALSAKIVEENSKKEES